MLPYGRHSIDEDDIAAVLEVLRSDRLTTGPHVERFEQAVCRATGAEFGVAVSSGTAALHCALHAAGVGPGDEVIVPTMTFAATANAVLYQRAHAVFCDVEPGTLLIDPAKITELITPRTRAVIAVDYAGQPCDYGALRAICDEHRLTLIADACHSLGARYRDRPVGSLADMTTFSFHPVKPITAGEGGMIVTNHEPAARKMSAFRHHGIAQDVAHRERAGSWFYEMVELGYNYRSTDIQCALATSQLRHLEAWTDRRRELAARYTEQLKTLPMIQPLACRREVDHAYHLYVVQIDGTGRLCRQHFFESLRRRQIGAHVHYIPVHLHPYYRRHGGTSVGQCPVAERAYGRILTLPLYPSMSDEEQDDVVRALSDIVAGRQVAA